MFALIISVLVIAAGLVAGKAVGRSGRRNAAVLIRLAALLFAAVLIVSASIASVPTGHTGVVTTFGRVENYTLDSGIHTKAPWQVVVNMDNRVQKRTADLSCFSSDIQEVAMLYTINYQIKKSDAMTIYSTIGQDYYDTVIQPSIAESVKVVSARYTAEQLVAQRDDLAQRIEENLADKLIAYNIEVVSTSIENMDFTDAFTNAVEEKQVAQQNKLRAQTEAEQKVIEAEAQAEVKKVAADAEAYEIQAKAAAEAEANRKIAESLTKNLIDYQYAQNWDGKLPEYYSGTGSETIPVLNLGE